MWTHLLTRALTGAVNHRGRVVVSLEASPCDTAIGDEDHRHKVPGGGERSVDTITNPSNERGVVLRAIIYQDIVIVAAAFKPGDIEETCPVSVWRDVGAHISGIIFLTTVTLYIT